MFTRILPLAVVALTFSSTVLAAPSADAGKAKYDMLCTACHGATGKADGPAGAALNPKPADFSSADFWSSRSDDDLKKVIKEGGPAVGKSPLMAGYGGTLTDEDIESVLLYLKSMQGK